MLLAIDVGNTNIVWALLDDNGKICHKWRLNTAENKTADEYLFWFKNTINQQGLNLEEISGAIIGSVVPSKIFAIKNMCQKFFKKAPLVIGEANVKLSGQALINNPLEVGADLMCNVIGAYKEYGGNLLIIDFGTATTFDVVDNDGNFIGSSFVSGVKISLEALYQKTALLPQIELAKPAQIIGRDTVEAMQSGIFWGYLSLVEGLIARIIKEYGKSLKVIATGGLANVFAEETSVFDIVDADITLKGLYHIYQDNN